MLTAKEIAQAWERADRMVERIYTAYTLGIGVEQARKDQKSLKVWLDSVRENGLVYNGAYDEFVELKF